MDKVCIQTQDFDVSTELAALREGDAGVGAVCCFVGTVRERSEGVTVSALELEHYPGMTEQSILEMIANARTRFGVRRATVIHRVGLLQLSEQIVMVAVTAAHRGESFQACEFLMDYLKTHAPFWKRETTLDGSKWVDARLSDDQALQRWGLNFDNSSSTRL